MRQIVLRLIDRPNSRRARRVRSASDWRLSGSPRWWTNSQARAWTVAWSRGGKDRLAAAAGSVGQGEVAGGPASAPEADAVGMELHRLSGAGVGQRRLVGEQADQLGTLAEGEGDRTAA